MSTKFKREQFKDSDVINIWTCCDCNETVEITPDFYQENGTPICIECDTDMNYSHTEINVIDLTD